MRKAKAYLYALPAHFRFAETFQADLRAAGLGREELFAGDATRKAITFHDLRATGITWMAVRGDDPLKIKARAGRRDFSTTEGDIPAAEQLAGADFGAVFAALPAGLMRYPGSVPTGGGRPGEAMVRAKNGCLLKRRPLKNRPLSP